MFAVMYVYLRVWCTMDMYFETPNILITLLKSFAVAVFASSHAYTLLLGYEYFYITITVVNFISIYQYNIGISISRSSLCHKQLHHQLTTVATHNSNALRSRGAIHFSSPQLK